MDLWWLTVQFRVITTKSCNLPWKPPRPAVSFFSEVLVRPGGYVVSQLSRDAVREIPAEGDRDETSPENRNG